MKALISIIVPGDTDARKLQKDTNIIHILERLKLTSTPYEFVDTMAGYGNLNQDWLEFESEIETSYYWVKPLVFDGFFETFLLPLLSQGRLVMMVHYIVTSNKNKKDYVPHH